MENCPKREELERYALGNITPAEKLQLNRHIRSCDHCKDIVFSIPVMVQGAAAVMSRLETEPEPCPSEALLADYVDSKTSAEQTLFIKGHIDTCNACCEVTTALHQIKSKAVEGNDRHRVWLLQPSSLKGIAAAAGLGIIALVCLYIYPMSVNSPASRGNKLERTARTTGRHENRPTTSQERIARVQPSSDNRPLSGSSADSNSNNRSHTRIATRSQRTVTIAILPFIHESDSAYNEGETTATALGKGLNKIKGVMIADAGVTTGLREQLENAVVRGSEPGESTDISKILPSTDANTDFVLTGKINELKQSTETANDEKPHIVALDITVDVLQKRTGETIYSKRFAGPVSEATDITEALQKLVMPALRSDLKKLVSSR